LVISDAPLPGIKYRSFVFLAVKRETHSGGLLYQVLIGQFRRP